MKIAETNRNNEITELLDTRLHASEYELDNGEESNQQQEDITEAELARVEKIFKSSSLQKQTSQSGVEPPKLDEIPGLKEFYKKKYFVKGASFASSPRLPIPSTSKSTFYPQSKLTSNKSDPFGLKKVALVDDEESSENDEEKEDSDVDGILEDAKKKRLSMSPLSKIDDTLKWIKSQSSGPDPTKFEFSLSGW